MTTTAVAPFSPGDVETLAGDAAISEGDRIKSFRRAPVSPERLKRVAEAATILGDFLHPDSISQSLRAKARLLEALSTSDFPNLLGAVFGRQLMATYQTIPKVWPAFATRTVVNDFRPKTWVDLLGGRTLLEPVGEYDPYPHAKASEKPYTFKVGKLGKQARISWEMVINDDLAAFGQLPDRLGTAAAYTEDYTATQALVTVTGPNSAFFTGGNGNAVVTGAGTALSPTSITNALTAVTNRLDSDGNPIIVQAYVLMVPPGLQVMANNILNANQFREVSAGSGSSPTEQMYVQNWLNGKLKVVVNPWIPVIDKSATAASAWYLLPDPATDRPAATLGFLRGHETPDLRRHADTGTTVGGGQIGAEDGSFDSDDIRYRARHVLGATTLDPIATYAAAGA